MPPCQITGPWEQPVKGQLHGCAVAQGPALRRASACEMLSCGHLEILNHLKQGALHFHPALGPTDYVTGPAYVETGANKLRGELRLCII